MISFDVFNSDNNGTAFRDVITLGLLILTALVVIMIVHINPPGKNNDKDEDPPGNLIVEIIWPGEYNTDVDLWVKAPDDIPVGYSNQSGKYFNLLRDDLGTNNDNTKTNFEFSYTRGIIPGKYVINLHLYRNAEGVYPIPVNVSIRIKIDAKSVTKNLISRKAELKRIGQEITVFVFNLNEDGSIDSNSINTTGYTPLRSTGP